MWNKEGTYDNYNNLFHSHCFIKSDSSYDLCESGYNIISEIIVNVNHHTHKWSININTCVYYCSQMGSCCHLKKYESLTHIIKKQIHFITKHMANGKIPCKSINQSQMHSTPFHFVC